MGAGEGVFYGPKIDLHMDDSLGRGWQMGTIQLDYQMPARFGLRYAGADNAEHTPVVIHRALLGSLERFTGILIEHYAGAFPVWLAPVQVRVVPVGEAHREAAADVLERLRRARASEPTSTSGTTRSGSGSGTPSSRRSPTSSSGATASPGTRWPSASAAASRSSCPGRPFSTSCAPLLSCEACKQEARFLTSRACGSAEVQPNRGTDELPARSFSFV